MEKIDSVSQIEEVIELGNHILYFHSDTCSISKDLYPKIEVLLENYPKIVLLKIDYKKIPEIKSVFSIYTTPAIIGYINGKEFMREARHISVSDIKTKIERYYEFM